MVPAWEKRDAYRTLEVELLLVYADSPYDKLVVLLGAHAGLRVSEMARLSWADVDLPRRPVAGGRQGRQGGAGGDV